MTKRSARRFGAGSGWTVSLGFAAVLLSAGAYGGVCYAQGKAKSGKRGAKEAAAAADGSGLELVALDEMQLGKAPAKAASPRKEAVAAAPNDSLDGLLHRSSYSEPESPKAPVKERMKFPGEKEKAEAPPAEKAEVVAPERITSDVTAKAIAAAKPSPAKPRNMMAAAAVVPRLPTKVKVGDDPLAGMAAKDMDDKGNKARKKTAK